MEYSAIGVSDRNDLLRQRLRQHEQAYFEFEVQVCEVQAVLAKVEDEGEKVRAKEIIAQLHRQMDEVLFRISAVKEMMVIE